MLQNTPGIVLRSVKYGETSLVTTIFTEVYGVQTYMVQGVRSAKTGRNKAGMLQPGMLNELVVYYQPMKNMQRLREFQPAYIYQSIQQDVVKNAVALFSIELLMRLLPEHAPFPELFEFSLNYFKQLDITPVQLTGNFPLFFLVTCGNHMGFGLKGNYCEETPHLNLQDGGFTAHPPQAEPFTTPSDAGALERIQQADNYELLQGITLNAAQRIRLTEWYILYLQQHSGHMGNIRSLAVLQAILH